MEPGRHLQHSKEDATDELLPNDSREADVALVHSDALSFAKEDASPDVAEAIAARLLYAQGSAVMLYATSSLIVIFLNKIVLATMGFPSSFVIVISQCTSTCFVVSLLRITGHVKLAKYDRATAQAVALIMVTFLFNTVSDGDVKNHNSLPMFTVLRRFSILVTMLMEMFILKSAVSPMVQLSIGLMIGGAVVAALFDLEFNLDGYLFILANGFFAAAYGVSIKRALNQNIPHLLFFNSLFSATALTLVVLSMPEKIAEITNFEGWRNPKFIALYICTSFMGSVLQYSIFVCTRVNSALTTSVVSMLSMGFDYQFELLNCIGLTISMGGSVLYSWAKIKKR